MANLQGALDDWTALNRRFWVNARKANAAREFGMSDGLLRKVQAFDDHKLLLFSRTELPHFRPSNPAAVVALLKGERGQHAYICETRIVDPATCTIYWTKARDESRASPLNAVTFWGLHAGLPECLALDDLDSIALLAYADIDWTLGDEKAIDTLADEVEADPREGPRLNYAHMGVKLAIGARGRVYGA